MPIASDVPRIPALLSEWATNSGMPTTLPFRLDNSLELLTVTTQEPRNERGALGEVSGEGTQLPRPPWVCRVLSASLSPPTRKLSRAPVLRLDQGFHRVDTTD